MRSGEDAGRINQGMRDLLAWAQLAALIVAAIVGVQSIRSTTAVLATQIDNLSRVVTRLDTTVSSIDGRLSEVERQSAYENGRRDAQK